MLTKVPQLISLEYCRFAGTEGEARDDLQGNFNGKIVWVGDHQGQAGFGVGMSTEQVGRALREWR
jgi:hypothetical protein